MKWTDVCVQEWCLTCSHSMSVHYKGFCQECNCCAPEEITLKLAQKHAKYWYKLYCKSMVQRKENLDDWLKFKKYDAIVLNARKDAGRQLQRLSKA